MKSYTAGLAILALGLWQSAPAAEITGKVKLKGTPKPEVAIDMAGTPYCGKAHEGQKVTTRHFVVSPDKGLANVFVYIKEGAKKTPGSGAQPVLDQAGCMYEPYVLGSVAGQPIKIRRRDGRRRLKSIMRSRQVSFSLS